MNRSSHFILNILHVYPKCEFNPKQNFRGVYGSWHVFCKEKNIHNENLGNICKETGMNMNTPFA